MYTEEENDLLLKEFNHARKDASKLRALRSYKFTAGIFSVILQAKVMVNVNGDYYVDHSSMSTQHLILFSDAWNFIPILTMRTTVPVTIELTSPEKYLVIYEANQTKRVTVTLKYNSRDFWLRNLEFNIFDEHVSEVLIGRPVIPTTRLNLETHLASFLSNYHDTDFCNI